VTGKTAILFPLVALATLALAWSYVGLRIAHSAIHLTCNRVPHRLIAYAASNVVLVMLWTDLLRSLSA